MTVNIFIKKIKVKQRYGSGRLTKAKTSHQDADSLNFVQDL